MALHTNTHQGMPDLKGKRGEEKAEDQSYVGGVAHNHLQTGQIWLMLLFLSVDGNYMKQKIKYSTTSL